MGDDLEPLIFLLPNPGTEMRCLCYLVLSFFSFFWSPRPDSALGESIRIAPSTSGQQSLPPAGHSENDSVERGQTAWVGGWL